MTTKKVAVIGSGNWGSAIALIVGRNVLNFECFHNEVKMYVYEEIIDGEKLTDIINKEHENIKYLPDIKLPNNVIAVPDPLKAAKDADIMIWVLPHKFVAPTCKPLIGKIKPKAVCVSLIKGFDFAENGGIVLISEVLRNTLKTNVCVMMGANIADEVARGQFCESTIGSRDPNIGNMLKNLMQTDNFRITVIDDVETIETCGSLKNIVAVGAGFADGLGFGSNTKAAIMRLGLMEMIRYCKIFYSSYKIDTFFESCGVADLITTCFGGRNKKVAEVFVKTGKTMEKLEEEMLQGQKLQGPQTAEEVYTFLKNKKLLEEFPLFVSVHKICKGEMSPNQFVEALKYHPAYTQSEKASGKTWFEKFLSFC